MSPTCGACMFRSQQNPATHHGTLVCRRQRLLWCTAPAKTIAKAFAAAHDRIPCHCDLQATQNARFMVLWPSGRTMSWETKHHQPGFLEGRPAPEQCVEIKVVSIANCAPPNNGSPFATISNRRASPGFGAAKSTADHDICCERTSLARDPCRCAFYNQAHENRVPTPAATDKGNGRRRRRNSNTQNSARWIRVRGHVGHVCSAAPAPEPPCDLSRALSGSANTLNRDSRCSFSIWEDASCYHPIWNSSGSRGGRKPTASAHWAVRNRVRLPNHVQLGLHARLYAA